MPELTQLGGGRARVLVLIPLTTGLPSPKQTLSCPAWAASCGSLPLLSLRFTTHPLTETSDLTVLCKMKW